MNAEQRLKALMESLAAPTSGPSTASEAAETASFTVALERATASMLGVEDESASTCSTTSTSSSLLEV